MSRVQTNNFFEINLFKQVGCQRIIVSEEEEELEQEGRFKW